MGRHCLLQPLPLYLGVFNWKVKRVLSIDSAAHGH